MTKYVPLDLPALVGDEPLGFLAAIGLANQLLENAYLSWTPDDHHAILHCRESSISSIDGLVNRLMDRLGKVRPDWAVPNETSFPLRRRRGGPDPLRIRPSEYRRRLDEGGSYWLKATLTDQETDAGGYCAVTPYIALRGRQTIGSFWYYPMVEVKKDPHRLLTEALTGWRRVDGADGWLLDHHATYTTHPEIRGPAGSLAVPGATWLATLAMGEFPFQFRSKPDVHPIEPTRPTQPILWHHLNGQDVMMWPLWTLPANSNKLQAVWNVGWRSGGWQLSRRSYATLQVRITPTHGVSAPDNIDRTVDLSIFTMCAAIRPHDGRHRDH